MAEQRKILVVYASLAGSTEEVARTIAFELQQQGARVDLYHVHDAPRPDGYDATVIGSAIRYGRWLPAVLNYLKKYATQLAQMPVALFDVGILSQQGNAQQKEEARRYSQVAQELVQPVTQLRVKGKIDFKRLGFFSKMLSKMMGIVEGDWRDFDDVRAWVKATFPLLTQQK